MTTLNPSGLYCAYLRKSRRDLELEALGQGETLARHEKQLSELAERLGITVGHWYREIVSGDTIAARPQVQRLLEDVNAGRWDGVLAMDVDRFGRGDSIDQGVIMQTFLYTSTLIVTPDKIYDPNDDSDAEFFEVKLFFSRREYSAIKKRMQRGRLASVSDGCYMGPRPVYGYERAKLKGRKGWTLKIVPEKAEIVRSIFSWYADGMDGREVGAAVIANRLNDMGLRTDLGHRFLPSGVRHLLQNPTYIGKVQWNQRVTTTRFENGVRVRKRLPCPDAMLIDGLHEPIIDRALWDRVQQMFAGHVKRPKNAQALGRNPLAGLVACGVCGRTMQRKPDYHGRPDHLFCPTPHCATASAYIPVVESAVLEIFRGWIREFDSPEAVEAARAAAEADAAARQAARRQIEAQLSTLADQQARLYDLVEQGVYSPSLFAQRRDELNTRAEQLRATLADLDATPAPDPRATILPQVKTVLATYSSTDDPTERNALLRTVVDHITFHKTVRNYRNTAPGEHLTLEIYPRRPIDQD